MSGRESLSAAGGFVCSPSDVHPYECGEGCRHCARTVSDSHDPSTCALCDPDYDYAPNELWDARKKQETKG